MSFTETPRTVKVRSNACARTSALSPRPKTMPSAPRRTTPSDASEFFGGSSIPVISIDSAAPPAPRGQKFRLGFVPAKLARELTTATEAPDSISGPLIPLRFDTVRPLMQNRRGETDMNFHGKYAVVPRPVLAIVSVAHDALARDCKAKWATVLGIFQLWGLNTSLATRAEVALFHSVNTALEAVNFPLRVATEGDEFWFYLPQAIKVSRPHRPI